MLAMPSRKPPAVSPSPSRQVNFRLRHDVWEWLTAAAGFFGHPQSQIVTEALQHYRTTLPKDDQKLIDQWIARRRTR
jgi:hypothetical protein